MKMVITDNIAPQVAIRKLHTDTYLDANCTKYFNDGEELRKCIDSIPVKTDTVISTALAAILKFKHFCINGTFLRYSARCISQVPRQMYFLGTFPDVFLRYLSRCISHVPCQTYFSGAFPDVFLRCLSRCISQVMCQMYFSDTVPDVFLRYLRFCISTCF